MNETNSEMTGAMVCADLLTDPQLILWRVVLDGQVVAAGTVDKTWDAPGQHDVEFGWALARAGYALAGAWSPLAAGAGGSSPPGVWVAEVFALPELVPDCPSWCQVHPAGTPLAEGVFYVDGGTTPAVTVLHSGPVGTLEDLAGVYVCSRATFMPPTGVVLNGPAEIVMAQSGDWKKKWLDADDARNLATLLTKAARIVNVYHRAARAGVPL